MVKREFLYDSFNQFDFFRYVEGKREDLQMERRQELRARFKAMMLLLLRYSREDN